MKNRYNTKTAFIFFFYLFILTSLHAQIELLGPDVVCPGQVYTYDVKTNFILNNNNQCGYPQLTIFDENNEVVRDTEGGRQFNITFPTPAKKTYLITVTAMGGFKCLNNAWFGRYVTTEYPIPNMSGPRVACPGQTVTFRAPVDASRDCFHHATDWELPSGWSGTRNGELITVTIPNSTPTGRYYSVRARVHYDDRNEFGDFSEMHQVWIGSPDVISGLSHPSMFGCTVGELFVTGNYQGATQFEWSVSGGTFFPGNATTYTGDAAVFVSPEDGAHELTVNVRSENGCGSSLLYTKQIPVECSGDDITLFEQLNVNTLADLDYSIVPNPADKTARIDLTRAPGF
ncbi:MAG: hypothetical protein AAGA66_03975, partial [Bacteroidota bacterium]